MPLPGLWAARRTGRKLLSWSKWQFKSSSISKLCAFHWWRNWGTEVTWLGSRSLAFVSMLGHWMWCLISTGNVVSLLCLRAHSEHWLAGGSWGPLRIVSGQQPQDRSNQSEVMEENSLLIYQWVEPTLRTPGFEYSSPKLVFFLPCDKPL